MLITHHGHSEFLLETQSGCRILTDPFDAHVGYPMRAVSCDAVTVSHGHGDHAFTEKAGGARVITSSGRVELTEGVCVTGIDSFHDDAQGAQRGKNLIFILEADGLRVAHLGDLGAWDDGLRARLTNIDILLLPVGGFFTIDADTAARAARDIAPHVVIPMHYRTQANASWPIAPVDGFLAAMNAQDAPRMPILRVTRGDIGQQPRVCVLAEG